MPSVALPAVERFVAVGLYLITLLRIDYVLVRLPIWALRLLAHLTTTMLCLVAPVALTESAAVIAGCFPDLPPRSVNRLAREHLTHVLWTMIVLTPLALMSDRQFDRLVDASRLRAFLQERGDRPLILVASHFFSHIMVAAVSACCHGVGVPLCGTLQLTEDRRLSRITEGLKRRFYWYENVGVNLSATDGLRAQFRALSTFLNAGRGAVLIFGDYRARPSDGDISFNVGGSTFHANRGFAHVVPKFGGADVVPIHLSYRAGRLEMMLGEVMPHDAAVRHYYERVLPQTIREGIAQWHLWFLARNMM